MPRFIHTADLHLNSLRRFGDYYLERASKMLQQISKIAVAERVDFIVVAGDVFDRRDITHSERLVLSDWLGSSNIPIVMISGNHDQRSSEVGDSCLTYLASLGKKLRPHIVWDGAPTVISGGGCQLVLIPYHGWMDQEFYLILDSLATPLRQQSKPIIIVAHEAVYGCHNDVGMSITKENQVRLDQSFPFVNYWALGDMHVAQAVQECAWYSGSPNQTRFDEQSDKGVLVVDTDDPAHPKFVPIQSIPLVILSSEPTTWPSPTEAFVQFRPDVITLTGALPTNVEYHPSVIATQSVTLAGEQSLVQLFDGLDDVLTRIGLSEDLFPLAWHLAASLAEKIGHEIILPEKYKVDTL